MVATVVAGIEAVSDVDDGVVVAVVFVLVAADGSAVEVEVRAVVDDCDDDWLADDDDDDADG